MGTDIRDILERRIAKKRQEVGDLETKVREATAYLQALEDTFVLLKTGGGEEDDDGEPVFRHGSDVAKARDFLRRTGKPLHISEILEGIGKKNDKKARVSLGSTLAGYVRKELVFTRPGPNIFGLTEFTTQPDQQDQEPPDDFGANAPAPSVVPSGQFDHPFDPGISDEDVPF